MTSSAPHSIVPSASSAASSSTGRAGTGPNTFGDAIAEHQAIRTDVGVWDASPLRKWYFHGPRRAPRRRPDLHERHARPRGRAGPVRAVLRRERQDGRRRDGVQGRRRPVHRRDRARLRSRPLHGRVVDGLEVEIDPTTQETPQLGINGPRSRELLQSLTDADVPSLATSASGPSRSRSAASRAGCRAPGTRASSATSSSARPTAPSSSGRPSPARARRPYGLAAVETIRIESGLIFIGYDYFQHETSPYDMGLDKMIRLDGPDFCGKAALEAESARARRTDS